MTACIHFLKGDDTFIPNNQHVHFRSKEPIFPKLLGRNVELIWKATSGYSHDSEEQKEYRKYIDSPFLLYSLAYLLCDVLIWFGKYVEAHPDPEANRRLWIEY